MGTTPTDTKPTTFEPNWTKLFVAFEEAGSLSAIITEYERQLAEAGIVSVSHHALSTLFALVVAHLDPEQLTPDHHAALDEIGPLLLEPYPEGDAMTDTKPTTFEPDWEQLIKTFSVDFWASDKHAMAAVIIEYLRELDEAGYVSVRRDDLMALRRSAQTLRRQNHHLRLSADIERALERTKVWQKSP